MAVVAEFADTNGGQGDLSVPRCVEGIKAAFHEFMTVLEAVLQAEEKHMCIERERVNDKQREAEAWCRKSSDQFLAWKVAAERVEKWYAMVHGANGDAQELASPPTAQECADDEARIAPQPLLMRALEVEKRANEYRSGRDPLSIATNIAAKLRVDSVAAALDDGCIRIPYGPPVDEPRVLSPLTTGRPEGPPLLDLAAQLSATAKPKLGFAKIYNTQPAHGDSQATEQDPDLPNIPSIVVSAPELIVSGSPAQDEKISALRVDHARSNEGVLCDDDNTFARLADAVAEKTGVEVTTLPEVQTHTV